MPIDASWLRADVTMGIGQYLLFAYAEALLQLEADGSVVHMHFLSLLHPDIRAHLRALEALIEPEMREAGLSRPSLSVPDPDRRRQVSENHMWIAKHLAHVSLEAPEVEHLCALARYGLTLPAICDAPADGWSPIARPPPLGSLELKRDEPSGRPYAEIRWYSPVLLTREPWLQSHWERLRRQGVLTSHFGQNIRRRRGMSGATAVRVWTVQALIAAGMSQEEAIGTWNAQFPQYAYNRGSARNEREATKKMSQFFKTDRRRLAAELHEWVTSHLTAS